MSARSLFVLMCSGLLSLATQVPLWADAETAGAVVAQSGVSQRSSPAVERVPEASQLQAAAQSGEISQARAPKSGIAIGLIAVGAALAIGLTALGTGMAQGRIGAAGAGTIAERPEAMGSIVILIAIPETMVILGFVVAVVLVFVL